MTKYAVACTHEDYQLDIRIVEAEGWKEALNKHPLFGEGFVLPDDLEDAKNVAVNECDFEFDVVEV